MHLLKLLSLLPFFTLAAVVKALPYKESTSSLQLRKLHTVAKVTLPLTFHAIPYHGTNYAQPGTAALLHNVAIAVTIGTQRFSLRLDTGSSDTWVVAENFTCHANNGTVYPQSACSFEKFYMRTSTFEEVADQHFDIYYGGAAGPGFTGILGHETVSLGGISVHSEIAVIDSARFVGYGAFGGDGILGMAYPDLTSGWLGPFKNISDDDFKNRTNAVHYNPVFFEMVKQGLVEENLFSILIDEGPLGNSTGGVLALGGVPEGFVGKEFGATKIIKSQVRDGPEGNKTVDTYYRVSIDGFDYPGWQTEKKGSSAANNCTGFIDSGTGNNIVPAETARGINLAFSPPGIYENFTRTWFVQCNATAPDVGIIVGGVMLVQKKDALILDNGDGRCFSGFQEQTFSSVILGEPFMKSVLSVFDIGKSEMRFAQR